MNPFYIGIFLQPLASYKKWKDEGVNLIVIPETEQGKHTKKECRAAIAALGLHYIDIPEDLADVENLVKDPTCLMLALPDEPDLHAPHYKQDPAGFQAFVDAFVSKWKPIRDAVAGRKHIWVNLTGSKVTAERPGYLGQMQKPFGDLADEISGDWYPINNNVQRYWIDYTASHNGEILPVTMVNCLNEYFPGKPKWACIEVCDQNLDKNSTDGDPLNKGRGPTREEFWKQANALIAKNISGIVYFAHNFGRGLPWDPAGAAGKTAWDGRNEEQLQACKDFAKMMNPPVDKYQTQIDALEARLLAVELKALDLQSRSITGIEVKRG